MPAAQDNVLLETVPPQLMRVRTGQFERYDSGTMSRRAVADDTGADPLEPLAGVVADL